MGDVRLTVTFRFDHSFFFFVRLLSDTHSSSVCESRETPLVDRERERVGTQCNGNVTEYATFALILSRSEREAKELVQKEVVFNLAVQCSRPVSCATKPTRTQRQDIAAGERGPWTPKRICNHKVADSLRSALAWTLVSMFPASTVNTAL